MEAQFKHATEGSDYQKVYDNHMDNSNFPADIDEGIQWILEHENEALFFGYNGILSKENYHCKVLPIDIKIMI